VEQPAVDHAVEDLGQLLQGQGVHDQERCRQPPLDRLLLGETDRLGEEVDARDRLTPAGEEQGVLPRAAPDIENRTRDPVGHVEHRLLRPADLPPGLPGVDALETAAAVYGHDSLRLRSDGLPSSILSGVGRWP
jgi:hypothetical protein